ncbi:MAG: methylmalonyl-CoA epimerase [Rhodobacter sp.]|nr:methylmalonyl-CoA epimerase [Rhodobacter sp.]
MRPLHAVVFAALLPFAALAEGAAVDPPAFGPLPAAEVVLADQMYLKRPVAVFADSPNDPNFIRQMDLLARAYPALEERDVIVVTDTDPEARSEWRQKLRPRGFSLVIMDKDLRPVVRKPLPWDVREITAAIDKLPLRRQEMLERNPAGR